LADYTALLRGFRGVPSVPNIKDSLKRLTAGATIVVNSYPWTLNGEGLTQDLQTSSIHMPSILALDNSALSASAKAG